AVRDRVVERIERRGKWLRIGLDDGARLFAHLGMTGWFEAATPGAPPLRFERVQFDLEREAARSLGAPPPKPRSRVVYVDARRWGRLVLARDDTATWRALGPDPLADGIDVDALAAKLARTKRSIKVALLDQRVLAGVGNIHAIEALWRARIDPRS